MAGYAHRPPSEEGGRVTSDRSAGVDGFKLPDGSLGRTPVHAFVDGLNLYNGLVAKDYRRFLWLDIGALLGTWVGNHHARLDALASPPAAFSASTFRTRSGRILRPCGLTRQNADPRRITDPRSYGASPALTRIRQVLRTLRPACVGHRTEARGRQRFLTHWGVPVWNSCSGRPNVGHQVLGMWQELDEDGREDDRRRHRVSPPSRCSARSKSGALARLRRRRHGSCCNHGSRGIWLPCGGHRSTRPPLGRVEPGRRCRAAHPHRVASGLPIYDSRRSVSRALRQSPRIMGGSEMIAADRRLSQTEVSRQGGDVFGLCGHGDQVGGWVTPQPGTNATTVSPGRGRRMWSTAWKSISPPAITTNRMSASGCACSYRSMR